MPIGGIASRKQNLFALEMPPGSWFAGIFQPALSIPQISIPQKSSAFCSAWNLSRSFMLLRALSAEMCRNG